MSSGTYGNVRCSSCNGRGGSHVPRMPSSPDYHKAWPWEECEKCSGTGKDNEATNEMHSRPR